MEIKYISVSQLNRYIAYKFDSDTNLYEVYLNGEIFNFKYSGKHCYFSLKDENSEISAMFFYPNNTNLTFVPKDGMNVNVVGRIQTYQKKGTYAIVVKQMQLEGVGLLYQQFLELKDKLAKEGLFSESRKLPLPAYPEVVGIITAPTGDAIHDIISTFNRRLPMAKLKLFPALVQGSDAPKDLMRALNEAYNDASLNAIIIGRGGGSFEDLSCFNDEALVRLLASSKIPTVSAIGHEADYTICDFVSSYRAPTPTGAAIALTKEKNDVIDLVNSYSLRLKQSMKNKLINSYNDLQKINNSYGLSHFDDLLEGYVKILDGFSKHLDLLSPENQIIKISNDINSSVERINVAFNNILNIKTEQILDSSRILNALDKKIKLNTQMLDNQLDKLVLLNPFNIMKKGYSITYKNDLIVSSVNLLNVDDELTIRFSDGLVKSVIKEKINK